MSNPKGVLTIKRPITAIEYAHIKAEFERLAASQNLPSVKLKQPERSA